MVLHGCRLGSGQFGNLAQRAAVTVHQHHRQALVLRQRGQRFRQAWLEDGPARALREALVRRLSLHRPSAAIVISLVALFFAVSGTAVAATGGSFILGKPNTATTVTSLSNTKGTALGLSSTSTTPPMTVSNSVQVPKLNASELGGHPASAFLGVNGTAANSSELGGQPASDYMTGTGQIAIDTATVASGTATDVTVPGSVSHDYGLSLECFNGTASPIVTATGATLQLWVLPPDGQPELSAVVPLGDATSFAGTTQAATWVLQVAFGSTMATTDWSAVVNASGTCTFAAQTISNG
jgi:hypothetical protein